MKITKLGPESGLKRDSESKRRRNHEFWKKEKCLKSMTKLEFSDFFDYFLTISTFSDNFRLLQLFPTYSTFSVFFRFLNLLTYNRLFFSTVERDKGSPLQIDFIFYLDSNCFI